MKKKCLLAVLSAMMIAGALVSCNLSANANSTENTVVSGNENTDTPTNDQEENTENSEGNSDSTENNEQENQGENNNENSGNTEGGELENSENTGDSGENNENQGGNENENSGNENTDNTDPNENSESGESGEGNENQEENTPQESDDKFQIITEDGTFSKSGNIYTLSAAGTYTLSGELEGQIYVEVGEEDDVDLELNGVEITYDKDSPIYVKQANNVKIKANKGTKNYIKDTRSLKVEDDDTQGNGAIYSKADLKLAGKGSLTVEAGYNNGVHSTDDLTIQKITLNVIAPNNAIKGNDSIEMLSGNVTAISTGGDGLKTEATDVSSKGKQRGSITISGGELNIYSACDGIDAAYDAVITDGLDEDGTTVLTPKVNIYTNKYSSYTGDVVSTSTSTMYLRTTSNNANYRYALYAYNNTGEEGVWSNAAYKTSIQSGGGRGRRTTYYYYELVKPSNYTSFALYVFNASTSENSLENYVAKTSGQTFNYNYDTLTFTFNSSQNTVTSGGWSNYASSTQQGGGFGPGGWDQGNTDKADESAKGIKADNEVNISGGVIYAKAYDDGIHANGDVLLENGSYGKGNVNISGGEITVNASDDGIHADSLLTFDGGNVNVETAYEGLEGNQIYVNDGEIYCFGTDDSVNAGSGNLTPLIKVTGGYLFAAVSLTGDTDGIDSNGNITITGGTVIACGPAQGGAWAVDSDGAVSVTGGNLIVFGGIERTPSTSNVTKTTKSGTYKNAFYTVTYTNGTQIETKKVPNYNYNGFISYSVNGTATIG